MSTFRNIVRADVHISGARESVYTRQIWGSSRGKWLSARNLGKSGEKGTLRQALPGTKSPTVARLLRLHMAAIPETAVQHTRWRFEGVDRGREEAKKTPNQ